MKTSCRCSARASEFQFPTTNCTMPPSIARPMTVRKSSTCRSAASSWAGTCRTRKVRATPLKPVSESHFEEFYKGTEGREASTTMVFVRLLAKLLRDPEIGKLIVPIIPDEARTFGMEALFRQVGIYSSVGQLYEPVDMDTLLYYKEAKNGQILEEGITEAGSMCSFIAAGHRVRQSRHQHDSVFYLLLNVRIPAHWRPDLGCGRHALPRIPRRRHSRPYDSRRRRPAASGRTQPRTRADRA